VRNPKVFLFDEPLSNLDAALRGDMRVELSQLHRSLNATMVYVTHDQIEAMTLASRIVVLKDGHVQQIGTPQEIYDTPANTFVADFMGSPPMNLIAAEVTERGLVVGGMTLDMGAGWRAEGLPQKVTLGVRPEHFALAEGRPDLTITPVLIENTGAESYIVFDLGGTAMTAKVPGRLDEDSVVPIGLQVARAALCYFDPTTGLRLTR